MTGVSPQECSLMDTRHRTYPLIYTFHRQNRPQEAHTPTDDISPPSMILDSHTSFLFLVSLVGFLIIWCPSYLTDLHLHIVDLVSLPPIWTVLPAFHCHPSLINSGYNFQHSRNRISCFPSRFGVLLVPISDIHHRLPNIPPSPTSSLPRAISE